MRMSLDPEDPGYDNWLTAKHFGIKPEQVRFKLNGVDQQYAITADEKAGTLERYVRPLRLDSNLRLLRETLLGKVEIIIPQPE